MRAWFSPGAFFESGARSPWGEVLLAYRSYSCPSLIKGRSISGYWCGCMAGLCSIACTEIGKCLFWSFVGCWVRKHCSLSFVIIARLLHLFWSFVSGWCTRYIIPLCFGSSWLLFFLLSAAKICLLAFDTVTSSKCNWLRFWRISAGDVKLVRVLILTVFALVQSFSRLFATFPLVRFSTYVSVVSWFQTLLSLSSWQSLPTSRYVNNSVFPPCRHDNTLYLVKKMYIFWFSVRVRKV